MMTRSRGEPPTGEAASASRRWVAEEGSRFLSGYDVFALVLLVMLMPVALLPRRLWRGAAHRLARRIIISFSEQSSEFVKSIPEAVLDASGLTRQAAAVEAFTSLLVEYIEVIAANLGFQKPHSIKVAGTEHLRQALAAGRGAVLWVEKAFSSSLVAKAAIAQQGFQVHHSSRPSHGVSNTRFGMRFLNGLYRRAESPYIAERIMLGPGRPMAAMRRMQELLKANQVVSITVVDTAAQAIETPALGGLLRLATGAPHLAYATGAALLPVFSYWDAGERIVEIGKPIAVAGHSRDEALRQAAETYASQLTAYVTQHPLDWSGWHGGTFSSTGELRPSDCRPESS